MKKKHSLVFFGSGPVAASSLRLISQKFLIEAVVTKPSTLEEMKAASSCKQIFVVKNKHELDALIDKNFLKVR
jgi:methionyl-tRNA formyltransferase